MKNKGVKKFVRESYAKIAKGGSSCCGSQDSGQAISESAKKVSRSIGYSDKELKAAPDGANLGLGCGNPTALASLKEGESVLDLGSGGGFDCFLAANKVGEKGKVIGVDMTPEMIDKARQNAGKNNVKNVEFRLGEIENLPVKDNAVDVVISNCVINLSEDKNKVFREIHRVLKPGGRVAISDIGLKKELPQKTREDLKAYAGCVAGALLKEDYEKVVKESGLKNVKITEKKVSVCIDSDTKDPIGRYILENLGKNESIGDYIVSLYVEASK